MLCSVVIPCHNGVEDTRACLQSLREQEGAPGLEIVLVDNGSTDETAGLWRDFPEVRILPQERNLGFAGGVNAGLRAARGDWLLVLNNDTCAAPDLLARLMAAARRDARIGLTAPVSNHVKGDAQVPVGNAGATREGRVRLAAALAESCNGLVQDVSTLSGLCLLMPRPAWERIGPFDERFGAGNFEDDDFCLRARLLGYRLVVARDAFLHHAGHRTFHALGLNYGRELERRQDQFRKKWQRDPAGAAWSARMHGDGAAAARHAHLALRDHPPWPDAYWILGEWHAVRGAPRAALEHLDHFVQACPFHGDAHGLRAGQWIALGDLERARAIVAWTLAECFVPAGRAAALLLDLARGLLRLDRPGEALDLLAGAAADSPEDATVHNLLGAALLQCDRLEEAERVLRRALELGDTEAYTNLGIVAWRGGRLPEAVSSFRAAVAARPDDQGARANLDQALRVLSGSGGQG